MVRSNHQNSETRPIEGQLALSPQASDYASSTVQRQNNSLDFLKQMIEIDAKTIRDKWAIALGIRDVFTAFALTEGSNRVIGTDISKSMLRQAKRLGQDRKIFNVHLTQNAAEALPFATQSVGLVSSRVSAHHFRDFEKALHEASRVLKIGGSLLMSDSVAPEQDEIASWMNDIQRRRDFSHIESRKISTITNILTNNGFRVADHDCKRIYLRFNEWTARTKLQSEEVEALRRDFLGAPDATREVFQVAPVHGNITFSWPCWAFRAVKR